MKHFLSEVNRRNPVLYYAGLISLLGAGCCLLLFAYTSTLVLGVNAYIKPFKFFFSISTVCFSMAWMLHYLQRQEQVRIYSWVLVFTMIIELLVITGQAALGKRSHFNSFTPLDDFLFALMGVAIFLFTAWSAWICYCFFRQKEFPEWMSEGYKWGQRWGLLFFVLFAFEGVHMVLLAQHSVGAADGSAGLPVTNWSKQYGDLRVPHFFGLHSLQLLPLLGYYLFPKKKTMHLVALGWLFLIIILYWEALQGLPLIP